MLWPSAANFLLFLPTQIQPSSHHMEGLQQSVACLLIGFYSYPNPKCSPLPMVHLCDLPCLGSMEHP